MEHKVTWLSIREARESLKNGIGLSCFTNVRVRRLIDAGRLVGMVDEASPKKRAYVSKASVDAEIARWAARVDGPDQSSSVGSTSS